MSKPLRPPSVEDLLLMVRMSGGRYDYRPDRMEWNIAMPATRLGVWKAIYIGEMELARQSGQDFIKGFINECLRANGEANG